MPAIYLYLLEAQGSKSFKFLDAISTRDQNYQNTNSHSAYDIKSEYWAKTSSEVVRKAFVATSQP
jgi:hypothetical protein